MPDLRFVVAAAVLAAAPAAAQEVEHGRWTLGSKELRGEVAWVTGPDDQEAVWRLTVACAANGLSIDLAPPEPPEAGATAVLTFNIGGSTYAAPSEAKAPGGDPVWLADLTDEMSSGLAKGYSMRVFAPQGSVFLGLTDSARTIGAVREACEDARKAAAEAVPEPDPETVESALRTHIAAACAPADPVVGDAAILSRDLTGDGRADHVIDWSAIACTGEDGAEIPVAAHCDEAMCDAEIFVSPALPPDPATDTIRHDGLELWPDRHVAIRTGSVTFDKPLNWRWDGTEFLASIPYNP